jgi:hypothetical protein
MLIKFLLAMIIAVLTVSGVEAQDWARKMFTTTSHDFGAVARGAKAEFRFPLSNIYLEDVHIVSVSTSCGCTSPRIEKSSLTTYEKGSIIARFNTDTYTGQRGATLTVRIDRPYSAIVQLHVKGYIRSDVVVNPGSIRLGDIDHGNGTEATVSISHAGRSDWKVLDVKSANPNISAKVTETGRRGGQVSYKLSVQLDKNTPPGYINDHLMLVTNDYRSKQFPVLVEGRVLSGIIVSPATLFMGVVEPGKKVTRQLVVRSKKPFRILSITCDDKSFEFKNPSEGGGEAKLVHLVPVTFLAGEGTGKVSRMIRIESDSGTTTPELAAYAVVAQ